MIENSHFSNDIYLLYPNIGLILGASYYHLYSIDGDLIVSPEFIKVGLTSAQAHVADGGTVLAWQGFKNFEFYCRQRGKPETPCTDQPILQ